MREEDAQVDTWGARSEVPSSRRVVGVLSFLLFCVFGVPWLQGLFMGLRGVVYAQRFRDGLSLCSFTWFLRR